MTFHEDDVDIDAVMEAVNKDATDLSIDDDDFNEWLDAQSDDRKDVWLRRTSKAVGEDANSTDFTIAYVEEVRLAYVTDITQALVDAGFLTTTVDENGELRYSSVDEDE